MSRIIFLVALLGISSISAQAMPKTILNLNIFDQLQGKWESDFRHNRVGVLSDWIKKNAPDLVVLEEAQGEEPGAAGGGVDSADAAALKELYPFRKYVHEMTGADGASYGYWIGSKEKPAKIWSDGFSFPGGVERKTIAALWRGRGRCLGVLGLHMSYQNSPVRQLEAQWILDWIKAHKKDCANWIVTGDFNADSEDKEIQILVEKELRSLVAEKKPTIGAFNPIRQIYGKDIPSRTIDWAFATANVKGVGEVVFDRALNDTWISDHAGVFIRLSR